MIKELLEAFKEQSGINLPTFGGFLKMGNSFMFNEHLKFNDGKLNKFLQESKSISKEEAEKLIEAFVTDIKAKLEKNENIDLGQIGILTSENDTIKLLKPVVSEVKEEKTKVVTPPKKEEKIVKETKKEEVPPVAKKEPIKKEAPKTEPVKKEVPKKEKEEKEKEETEEEGYLSIHFTAKLAAEKIKQLSEKQELIEFTSGDKRKSVVDALNKKLNQLNKIDPSEINIVKATKIAPKEDKKEEKILEGSDKEVKKQVAKESDILNTVKEKEKEEKEKVEKKEEKEKEIKKVVTPLPKEPAPEVKKEDTVIPPVVKKEPETTKVPSKEEFETKEISDKEALIVGAEKLEKEAKGRKRNKVILLIAVICILSGGGIVGYLKMDVIKGWFNSSENQIAKVDDAHEEANEDSEESSNEVPENNEIVDNSVTEDVVEENTEEESAEEIVAEETEPVEEEVIEEVIEEVVEEEAPVVFISGNGGNYHIIVGSFSKEKNANQLVKELKADGYSSAGILGTFNGLQSVKMGSYPTKDQARQVLKDSGKDGWVKKH